MKLAVEYCDLCCMDGEKRKAIAQYWDEDGKRWVICRKCLNLVQQTTLEWEKLEANE